MANKESEEDSDKNKVALNIKLFKAADRDAVIELWRRCDLLRPWNDPHKDIERKLADSPDLFFVAHLSEVEDDKEASLVATAMAGYEGHRGWVNYLAVDPDYQGRGVGRSLMRQIEAELLSRGCPKINLQIRETNSDVIAFYHSLDYKVDAAVSMGKRLIPDD